MIDEDLLSDLEEAKALLNQTKIKAASASVTNIEVKQNELPIFQMQDCGCAPPEMDFSKIKDTKLKFLFKMLNKSVISKIFQTKDPEILAQVQELVDAMKKEEML
jgi:hypothetical protein